MAHLASRVMVENGRKNKNQPKKTARLEVVLHCFRVRQIHQPTSFTFRHGVLFGRRHNISTTKEDQRCYRFWVTPTDRIGCLFYCYNGQLRERLCLTATIYFFSLSFLILLSGVTQQDSMRRYFSSSINCVPSRDEQASRATIRYL